jgi:hypothetical protein
LLFPDSNGNNDEPAPLKGLMRRYAQFVVSMIAEAIFEKGEQI